ncbi:MAG: thioredoxin domain-containing protein, partial [Candidatus Aenigmarchaeota archaeon]|nr:thioredoxin domain-containing protein [Candidatus Aenigmarchaeota archaeon]
KMLYDQAMHLWVYSWAHKVLGKPEYKAVAEKIIKCLEETFETDGLFCSAHDADTAHKEGETYLWPFDEVRKALDKDELKEFLNVYEVTENGNFEGKNHLLKKENTFLPEMENKLLEIRKKREQPFVDRKIVTSWNALAGIGLLMAYRHAGIGRAKGKAEAVLDSLLKSHYAGGRLFRSSLEGALQRNEFLEDCAAVLLLAAYLFEETGKRKELVEELYRRMEEFHTGGRWLEGMNEDFMQVPAQAFDHPIPSCMALAEMAELKACMLLGKGHKALNYRRPLAGDFHNLAALLSRVERKG